MQLFVRDDTTHRARAMWAKSIARMLEELERSQPPMRSIRRLYRRDVGAACAHSLTEVRCVLIDDTSVVRPEAMRRLREFLTDSARSPLDGDDAGQARRTSRELGGAFVAPAHAHLTRPAISTDAPRDDARCSSVRA